MYKVDVYLRVRRSQEMFVPLSHPPGHAQCDFGDALVVIGGVERMAHCFIIDLPRVQLPLSFGQPKPARHLVQLLDGEDFPPDAISEKDWKRDYGQQWDSKKSLTDNLIQR